MKRFFLSFILLGCFFQLEAQERTANDTILMLENKSLNDVRDYNWLIKTLSRECKYPVAQQKRNKGCVLQVEYTVPPEGYISHATVLNQAPRAFRKSVMQVFQSLRNVPTVLRPGKSTLSIQFWLDNMKKSPKADVVIIGYTWDDKPVLMM